MPRRTRSDIGHNHYPSYIKRFLLWADQGLNVVFGPIFNLVLNKGNGFNGPFGHMDETISSVLGKFEQAIHLGLFHHPIIYLVSMILDTIDDYHCVNSIELDEGWTVAEIQNKYGRFR